MVQNGVKATRGFFYRLEAGDWKPGQGRRFENITLSIVSGRNDCK